MNGQGFKLSERELARMEVGSTVLTAPGRKYTKQRRGGIWCGQFAWMPALTSRELSSWRFIWAIEPLGYPVAMLPIGWPGMINKAWSVLNG